MTKNSQRSAYRNKRRKMFRIRIDARRKKFDVERSYNDKNKE